MLEASLSTGTFFKNFIDKDTFVTSHPISPLHAIAKFEKTYGIEHNFINKTIISTGSNGSFSRLERGEIDISTFARLFEKECETAGKNLNRIFEYIDRSICLYIFLYVITELDRSSK